MLDQDKSKQELIEELAEMRRRIGLLETADTKRKQAEQALQEREARLLEVQEVADLGFYVFDIAAGRFSTSAVLDRLFGISADYERTVDGWASLIHRDERQRMLDYLLKEVVGEKKPFDCEYRIVRYGEKQVRWVHGLGRLQFNTDGQPVSMLGTIQDITEQKQAEEALCASETKYRRLHQSMMDAFVSVAMDGFIQEYNEAYLKLLGYEPEELLKLRYTDITPEKWHSYEADIVQKQILPRGHSEIYEKEYRRKDGTVFPVELRTFLVKDDHGQPIAMWAIVRDISQRKQAEQALQKAHDELEQRVKKRTAELAKANKNLRQSNNALRTIYDGMVEGLLVTDIETKRFVRVNPAMCRMLGYSEKELLAASIEDIHPPEEVPNDLQRFQAASEGRVSINEDRPVLRKDGSVFYADITGHRVFYDERPCLLALFRDITKRKQVDEALRRSEKRLAERTALAEWRASQLQRLAAELAEVEERERRRLSQVLHDDLQQILVAAELHVGAMQEISQDDKLAGGMERVQSLLREALEASRSLTAELSPPILYEQGLVATLEWLVFQTQEKFQLKTSVEADPRADLKGEGIGSFIYQATRELILNVAKHGHATHVAIRLSYFDEDHIRLVVTDDGVGCDPERLHPRSDSGGFRTVQHPRAIGSDRRELGNHIGAGPRHKGHDHSSVHDSPIKKVADGFRSACFT